MKIEKDVETYLVLRAKALGGRTIKLIGEEGLPDRLVLLPGVPAFFCELKRPEGGRRSPIQKIVHEKLRKIGCHVYVAKNKEEIDQMIKEETNG